MTSISLFWSDQVPFWIHFEQIGTPVLNCNAQVRMPRWLSMNAPTQTQMTLMFLRALSHEGWDSLIGVDHGQKREFHLLLQNKLPASTGLVSHLFVHAAKTCLPSRQAKGLLLHEASSSWHEPFQQLQYDHFVRWDVEQRCFGSSRGQLESDFWAAGPLKSLIPEDITMTMLVPEPVLVLISLQSLFSPATYDPIFYFSNLSGSSHHVKQRSDLAWKKAVTCFL